MGDQRTGAPDGQRTRLGIALSGGGFRAAYFHIGLLARLAELDLLRQVEGISTVSGGSVIGAMYYLKLRTLLQSTPDEEIRTHHYTKLVDELWRQFDAGVRHNLRMRTFANPIKNWKMYGRNYSRSDRMGELYTHYFYRGLVEQEVADLGVPLSRVRIQPLGEEPEFNPFAAADGGGTSNDRRRNKVPALLLNTTTLNTGHNYRFTPTWIGEARTRGRRSQIDLNTRLRRMYIDGRDTIPEKYRRLPLGIAVAASTAVPGLFHPLALTDLYQQLGDAGAQIDWTPQLVDGGVHDNQGVEALIDQGCSHLVVSDACGQMADDPDASPRAFAVIMRSNSIMMDRVREEEYESASLLAEGRLVDEHVFFHMLQGLQQPELTWIGGDHEARESAIHGEASHGMERSVQVRLAHVRTDLDSFTEVEARALMAAGYLVASEQVDPALGKRLGGEAEPVEEDSQGDWGFMEIGPYLADPGRDPLFGLQLDVASRTAFKLLARYPLLKWSLVGASGLAVALALWALLTPPLADQPFAPTRWLAERIPNNSEFGYALLLAGVYAALFLLPKEVRLVANLRNLPRTLALRAGAATVGCLVVWTHLLTGDKWFQRQGRFARLTSRE